MEVTYESNNSGGRWWLSDEDWRKLAAAGWVVRWAKDEADEFIRAFVENGRYMGALADRASLECETPADAVRSFETWTGQDASDEGCNCCGAPHYFSWKGGSACGADIVALLYGDDAPKSLREAVERAAQREKDPREG